MTNTELQLIDWRETVPASVATTADHWQVKVHQAIANSVLVTGQALRAMKELMPTGAFEAWWRQDLGLTDRKRVSDLMKASELLETQASDTPLAALSPRTLAILQRAGSGEVLEEAVERLENGGKVTEAEARRIAAAAKPKALSESLKMRLLGILNDERVVTLSGFIKGRNAAMARLDALNAAADLDPALRSLSKDDRLKQAGSHALAKLMEDALTEVYIAETDKEAYMQWCWQHRCKLPGVNHPVWQRVKEAGGVPVPELWQEMRSEMMAFSPFLKGHRDSDAALKLYAKELMIPRDRVASPLEVALAQCLEPWEVFADAWMGAMMEMASSVEANRRK